MQTVSQQLGIDQFPAATEHPSLVSTSHIGIELELEGITSESMRKLGASGLFDKHWRIESDGSLRNYGMEFVTSGGKGGQDLFDCIHDLCSALSKVNYDASPRCSTHMHVDMLDATKRQVLQFILVYAAVEPILFRTGGEYRWSSNFCVPMAEAMPHTIRLMRSMAGRNGTIQREGYMSRIASKYSALNILPLYSKRPFGTIEFRGAGPIVDPEQMLKLANQLLYIKKVVMENTGSEEELLSNVAGGLMFDGPFDPQEWAEAGCDESMMNSWVLVKAYKQALRKGGPEPSRPNSRPFPMFNPHGEFRTAADRLVSQGLEARMLAISALEEEEEEVSSDD